MLLSQEGHYFGRLVSSETGYGALRVNQYSVYNDPATVVRLAGALAIGKVTNQVQLLKARRVPAAHTYPLVEIARRMGALVSNALGQEEGAKEVLEVLRGLEGQASALYFRLFKGLLKNPLGFEGRARRPPKDPINSLLSFGYTLLTSAAENVIRAVGLDPYCGFLHSLYYSRPSLALDLVEEFRPLVDRLVLWGVNLGRYKEQDFRKSQENPGAVLLTDEARRRYVGDYERMMAKPLKVPGQDRAVPVRRALELQARQLARVICGKQREYKPISLSWVSFVD